MRVMVIGSKGMLGQEVMIELTKHPHAYKGFCHKDLDIIEFNQVKGAVRDYKPDVVINCAGLVKGVSDDGTMYMAVNTLGPINIASACDAIDARLIQVSTDCVFTGKNGPYKENDTADAEDLYGKSKLDGEITRYPHLTIRTSFVGFGKHGLLNWAMRQKGVIPGYIDSLWNGLTSREVAKVLVSMIDKDYCYGLLHLGTWRTIDKYYLLQLIKKVFNLPYEVEECSAPDYMKGNKALFSKRRNWDLPLIETMLYELKHSRL